jgi:hydrogenase 3 maturation protease
MERIERALRTALAGRSAVLMGVGQALRGDDGFGPAAAGLLAGRAAAPVIDAGGAPENFSGAVRRRRPEVLVVLDAADFGGAPGELRLLGPGELAAGGLSTHAAGLRLLFDYLRAECGTEALVLAAQAGSLDLGAPMSPAVAAAARRAAELVLAALAEAPAGA